MILECPRCAMRYHLDDHMLGTKGSKVRCTECGTIWYQSASDERKQHFLPPALIKKNIWHKKFIITAGCVLVILAGLALFWERIETEIHTLSDNINILWNNSIKSLELSSFGFERKTEKEVSIYGRLHNPLYQEVENPTILVTFFAPNTHKKNSVKYTFQHLTIAPGAHHDFIISLEFPDPTFTVVQSVTVS